MHFPYLYLELCTIPPQAARVYTEKKLQNGPSLCPTPSDHDVSNNNFGVTNDRTPKIDTPVGHCTF